MWHEIFRGVRAASAVYGLWYVWVALNRPHQYEWAFMPCKRHPIYRSRDDAEHSAFAWPRLIVAAVGIFSLIYCSGFVFTSLLPASGGYYDEDGYRITSARNALQLAMAGWGSLWFLTHIEQHVRRELDKAKAEARLAAKNTATAA